MVPHSLWKWMAGMRGALHDRRLRRVESIFLQAPRAPEWLERADLECLSKHHIHTATYGYDPTSLEERGEERARNILKEVPGPDLLRFLDLACMDGMTAAALQKRGKQCWGVDTDGQKFDPRARAAGVHLEEMDAMALDFPDGHFDVVYSFNAFEHFADPATALHEALRVVRTGGYIYLHFGPLFGSAKGLHVYDRIPVPYCQYLFPIALMNEYLRDNRLPELDPDHCNRWPVQRYRALWNSVAVEAEIIDLTEFTYTDALDIVERYPSCFRGKAEYFDELLVNIMHVVLRKR
jgi:SAM-dependent methyltransferase